MQIYENGISQFEVNYYTFEQGNRNEHNRVSELILAILETDTQQGKNLSEVNATKTNLQLQLNQLLTASFPHQNGTNDPQLPHNLKALEDRVNNHPDDRQALHELGEIYLKFASFGAFYSVVTRLHSLAPDDPNYSQTAAIRTILNRVGKDISLMRLVAHHLAATRSGAEADVFRKELIQEKNVAFLEILYKEFSKTEPAKAGHYAFEYAKLVLELQGPEEYYRVCGEQSKDLPQTEDLQKERVIKHLVHHILTHHHNQSGQLFNFFVGQGDREALKFYASTASLYDPSITKSIQEYLVKTQEKPSAPKTPRPRPSVPNLSSSNADWEDLISRALESGGSQ